MARDDVALVARAFPMAADGGEVDMGAFFSDQDNVQRLEELISDDAVVEFATPDGGFVGDMAGPFRGVRGLLGGWAEWLAPWASVTFRGTDLVDAGNGRVLMLGDLTGRMESGVEMHTPVGALYTVAGGVIATIEHFLDQDQARRAASLGGPS